VHQNLTFPVHPEPVSGMHCWHQKVRVERAAPEDRYGDVFVDTNKSFQVYEQWLKRTRPAPVLMAYAVRSGSRAPSGPRTKRTAIQKRRHPELVYAHLPPSSPSGRGLG
jgi:hypothetical protein